MNPGKKKKLTRKSPGLKKSAKGAARILSSANGTPLKKKKKVSIGSHEKIDRENSELKVEVALKSRALEIEAALEKVRSASLAMHSTSELEKVVAVLFNELSDLGLSFDGALILLFEKEKRNIKLWIATNQLSGPARIDLPFDEGIEKNVIVHDLWGAIEKGNHIINRSYSGKEKDDYFRYVAKHNPFIPEDIQKIDLESESWTATFAAERNCVVGFDSWTGQITREEDFQILKRFARVFEQAYVRFLDLQKAETRTREAQIEVAVERVRAKALAMHRSEDLHDAVVTLKKEMMGLQIPGVVAATIYLKQDDSSIRVLDLSSTTEEGDDKLEMKVDKVFRIEDTDPKLWVRRIWDGTENYFVEEADEDDFVRLFKWLYTIDPVGAEIGEKIVREKGIKKVWLPTVKLEKGKLNIDLLDPPTPEIESILLKMGAGFDLAYKRFLDLQKAEAQTREAQIELGLERVRARAMAMQNSEELKELIATVLNELTKLGFDLLNCTIMIYNEGAYDSRWWMANSEDPENPIELYIKKHDHPPIAAFFKAWKERRVKWTYLLEGQVKKDWDVFLFNETELKTLPDRVAGRMENLDKVYLNASFNNFGNLAVNSFKPLNDSQFDILLRFAKVFDLTYTRFNDLQKAEAQVREAKIEAALEKVRAKTMAMRESSEVTSIAVSLNEELWKLGFQIGTQGGSSIVIIDNETGDTELWTGFSEDKTLKACRVPYFQHPFIDALISAWRKGETFLAYTLAGDEKKSLDDYYFETGFKDFPEGDKNWMRQMTSVTFSHAFMKYGAIHWAPHPLTEEQLRILERFSKVFEQSYTRFLDLKRAEAQAREAQIEAALEKIRSRSLAMHKSNELKDVVAVLFEKLREFFETDFDAAGLQLFTEGCKDSVLWIRGVVLSAPVLVNHPYDEEAFNDSEVLRDILLARETGEPVLNKTYSFEEKNKLVKYTGKYNPENGTPLEVIEAMTRASGYTATFIMEKNSGLWVDSWSGKKISTEEFNVSKRIAKVFEQAYIRFLDLQKAEAQAREAQIEAALEKVRSASLAMHSTKELEKVVTCLFDRMTDLGLAFDGALIFILDDEKKSIYSWVATTTLQEPFHGTLPYHESVAENLIWKDLWNFKKERVDVINKIYSGKEKNDYFSIVGKHDGGKIPAHVKKLQQESDWVVSWATERNCLIGLDSWSGHTTSETDFQILKRFSKVFEQAYTRFLDLQKAEAQAREAQIEAALEKVRSRSLAMHKSDELQEVIETVFARLIDLNLVADTVSILIPNKELAFVDFWVANKEHTYSNCIRVAYVDKPVATDILDAWGEGKDFFSKNFTHEEKKNWWDYAFEHTEFKNIPEERKKWIMESPHFAISVAITRNIFVQCVSYAGLVLEGEEAEILKRFARVFDQAYTRFLDLQKAEAQAREAQIEAALEKVRSRSMGMQKSEELRDVIKVVFDQLIHLNFQVSNAGFIMDVRETDDYNIWMADALAEFPTKQYIPYFDHVLNRDHLEFRSSGRKLFTKVYSFEEKNSWLDEVRKHITNVPDELMQVVLASPALAVSRVDMKNVALYLFNYAGVPYSDDENATLMRFGNVFEQTYTRFNDLRQAEDQAREAQIEAALERVRSKAMAMHKSEDLNDAVAVVFEELDKLNLGVSRCGLNVLNKEKRTGDIWVTAVGDSSAVQISGDESFDIHPLLQGAFDAWLKQEDFYYLLEGEDLTQYYKAIKAAGFQLPPSQFVSSEVGHKKQFCFFSVYHAGGLFAFRDTEFPEEAKKVMKRFAGVFDLTYKRFLDLQKAEFRAREATIEAALERVRGRAMAMHNSADLSSTASLVFVSLRNLGINPLRSGIGIVDKERVGVLYASSPSGDGETLNVIGSIRLEGHSTLEGVYQCWEKGEVFLPRLNGEELRSYYQLLSSSVPMLRVHEFTDDEQQYGHFIPYSAGVLYAWSERPYSEDEINVLKRFSAIIDLTYRRYVELQQAESNAREAVRQASLNRLRAEIASMRKTKDLERITPLIWNELTTLGVNFIRCGVFIMNEQHELIHAFLSTPDGRAIIAFHLPFSTSSRISEIFNHWKANQSYISHWGVVAFNEVADALIEQRIIATRNQYLSTVPHDGIYLHCLPFLQGMLYVGNTVPLKEGDTVLIQSVADAFSTAYARYEDFNKLETAKQQVEQTLTDLKQAQQRLVQSEKMASLGELTAGIAHEIQNPLNFVNNFSEVSKELLDEMKEELKSGNASSVAVLASDVIENLEKITFHGKRADAIVKSMLQHSRKSTGQKELTDINALCDEYLRLSYHGLRAKDKSFNAKFETDFDLDIPQVNVVPQEIGRVILNLINNAFYAVSERARSEATGYVPHVKVSTKNLNGKIEIRVKDNGTGVPENVKEKIFQPFFTTKPTGQGTGLGLSLAYDIITKGHNGELKIETKEGTGSEFIIQLPKSPN